MLLVPDYPHLNISDGKSSKASCIQGIGRLSGVAHFCCKTTSNFKFTINMGDKSLNFDFSYLPCI